MYLSYSHVDNESNSVDKHFQLSMVYLWQRNVILAAINQVDSVVVQPTGSEKSLCYVTPHLYHGRTAVVVLPTISLMSNNKPYVQTHRKRNCRFTFEIGTKGRYYGLFTSISSHIYNTRFTI